MFIFIFIILYQRNAFLFCFFFFSSRRRHTRCSRDWSSDVCSSDLFDGPCNPAGPGLRSLGRIDPADPIATTDGREVLPQRLRLVGIGKGHREIGGGCRVRGWSPDKEVHPVARARTRAPAHGGGHTPPVASGRGGVLSPAQ